MRVWGTEIKAISPMNGELKTFGGPNIQAPTKQLAIDYCQLNGLGYCRVVDELVCEIPCKEGGYEPDFDNKIDYMNEN